MEVAKDTGKQEKRRMVIRGAGSGVGGVVVWGGLAVVATGFLVASVSAFKSWRNKENTRVESDELNKGDGETDTPSIEYDIQSIETMGKMREDKIDQANKALNKDEVSNAEEGIIGMTQEHQLAKDQFNNENIKVGQEAILAVQKPTYIQFDRERIHEFPENGVKKDEELAEEIDVYTPMSHENEEESDENSSISADVEEFADKDTYLQNMEKQQEPERMVESFSQVNQFADESKSELKDTESVHKDEEKEEESSEISKEDDGDGIVKREERVIEASPMFNQFANEDKFEVTEKELVHEEEEKEDDGKVMVEKVEELSDRDDENEEEEEEEESENSEETGDSSMESNVDAVWPAEAAEEILMDIKQRKIDDEISEEISDDYIIVENKEKSVEYDTNYPTNSSEIEVSGESVFISRKSNIRGLWLNLSNTRTLIWAILVMVLALAAPLVLSPKEIMKLSLVTFFMVSISRVLKIII